MFLCESLQYINLVFAYLYFHPIIFFNNWTSSLDGDPNELTFLGSEASAKFCFGTQKGY